MTTEHRKIVILCEVLQNSVTSLVASLALLAEQKEALQAEVSRLKAEPIAPPSPPAG